MHMLKASCDLNEVENAVRGAVAGKVVDVEVDHLLDELQAIGFVIWRDRRVSRIGVRCRGGRCDGLLDDGNGRVAANTLQTVPAPLCLRAVCR